MTVIGLTLKDEIARLKKVIADCDSDMPHKRKERDEAVRKLAEIRGQLMRRATTWRL